MARFIYRFIGDQREHFSFLPADPPSRWLEPGDTVVCSAPLEDARFQLQKSSSTRSTTKPEGGDPTP